MAGFAPDILLLCIFTVEKYDWVPSRIMLLAGRHRPESTSTRADSDAKARIMIFAASSSDARSSGRNQPAPMEQIRHVSNQAREAAKALGADSRQDFILQKIVETLAAAGDMAGARRAARGMAEHSAMRSALRSIAACQAQQGKFVAARKTAGDIGDPAATAAALAYIAGAQAMAGQFPQALKAARVIDDPYHRVYALRCIAEEQVAADKGKAALKGIAEAWQQAEELPDPFLRHEALVGLTRTRALAGDVDGAIQAAAAIPQGTDVADARTGIAEALAKLGRLEEAFAQVDGIEDGELRTRSMLRVAWRLHSSSDPDGVRAAINRSLEIGTALKDPAVKANVLTAIADAQSGMLEDRDAADKTLRKVTRAIAAVPKNDERRGSLISEVVFVRARYGDFAGAHRTAKNIDDIYDRDDALETIASFQSFEGDIPGAFKTVKGIESQDTMVEALYGIALGQAKAGDVPAAEELAAEQHSHYARARILLGAAEGILERMHRHAIGMGRRVHTV